MDISNDKLVKFLIEDVDSIMKEKLEKRETESLLIAAQNNAIRTNYIIMKTDNIHHNSKCRLCGDKDEMFNHIVSKCSKLEQKEFKTRYDWVGKVIPWELCK